LYIHLAKNIGIRKYIKSIHHPWHVKRLDGLSQLNASVKKLYQLKNWTTGIIQKNIIRNINTNTWSDGSLLLFFFDIVVFLNL